LHDVDGPILGGLADGVGPGVAVTACGVFLDEDKVVVTSSGFFPAGG
jgi:hypothetical protein